MLAIFRENRVQITLILSRFVNTKGDDGFPWSDKVPLWSSTNFSNVSVGVNGESLSTQLGTRHVVQANQCERTELTNNCIPKTWTLFIWFKIYHPNTIHRELNEQRWRPTITHLSPHPSRTPHWLLLDVALSCWSEHRRRSSQNSVSKYKKHDDRSIPQISCQTIKNGRLSLMVTFGGCM